jgi:hypothetical protein
MGAGRSSFRVKAMSSFHVGQLVVCVDAAPSFWGVVLPLVEGRVYTVAGVFPPTPASAREGEVCGLTILEEPDAPPHWGHVDRYRGTRFRPAKLASKEVFDQLTAPFKRENAREDA